MGPQPLEEGPGGISVENSRLVLAATVKKKSSITFAMDNEGDPTSVSDSDAITSCVRGHKAAGWMETDCESEGARGASEDVSMSLSGGGMDTSCES